MRHRRTGVSLASSLAAMSLVGWFGARLALDHVYHLPEPPVVSRPVVSHTLIQDPVRSVYLPPVAHRAVTTEPGDAIIDAEIVDEPLLMHASRDAGLSEQGNHVPPNPLRYDPNMMFGDSIDVVDAMPDNPERVHAGMSPQPLLYTTVGTPFRTEIPRPVDVTPKQKRRSYQPPKRASFPSMPGPVPVAITSNAGFDGTRFGGGNDGEPPPDAPPPPSGGGIIRIEEYMPANIVGEPMFLDPQGRPSYLTFKGYSVCPNGPHDFCPGAAADGQVRWGAVNARLTLKRGTPFQLFDDCEYTVVFLKSGGGISEFFCLDPAVGARLRWEEGVNQFGTGDWSKNDEYRNFFDQNWNFGILWMPPSITHAQWQVINGIQQFMKCAPGGNQVQLETAVQASITMYGPYDVSSLEDRQRAQSDLGRFQGDIAVIPPEWEVLAKQIGGPGATIHVAVRADAWGDRPGVTGTSDPNSRANVEFYKYGKLVGGDARHVVLPGMDIPLGDMSWAYTQDGKTYNTGVMTVGVHRAAPPEWLFICQAPRITSPDTVIAPLSYIDPVDGYLLDRWTPGDAAIILHGNGSLPYDMDLSLPAGSKY